MTGAPDLDGLLKVQRDAFLAEGVPTAAIRRDRIDRLIALLTENVDEFAAALQADFGSRPPALSRISEAAGIIPDMLVIRARLERWMREERVRFSWLAGLPTTIEKRPRGVVGIIGPWNFPIGLIAQPAAAAFAAGNRVMGKFSDITPETGQAFARRVSEYFEPAEFVVVNGGVDTAVAFSRLPFDHLFFTGSPEVGSLVAQEAACNLVPVTLELGGKNPAVVASPGDVPQAARRVMAARLVNGGQLCLCPDDAYVPEGQVAAFVDAALAEAGRIAPRPGPELVSIVNQKNFDRVCALIDDAARKGAQVHRAPGGGSPDPVTRWIPPTILTGVTDDMAVAHDEVFGPILAVHAYASVGELVRRLSDRPSPLAAYWFGSTSGEFRTFKSGVISGGLTVNDFAAHNAVPGTPFGGIGRSGSGAYHGRFGFDVFSHQRTVTRSRLPVSLGQLTTPPFSRVPDTLVRVFLERVGRRARSQTRHRNNSGNTAMRGEQR